MTIKELKAKRDELAKKNIREYQRWGNTQRCQELFKEMQTIEAEIGKIESQIDTVRPRALHRKEF